MASKKKNVSKRATARKPKRAPRRDPAQTMQAVQAGAQMGAQMGDALSELLGNGARLAIHAGPTGVHIDYLKPPEEKVVRIRAEFEPSPEQGQPAK